jgi:hypothetical protein
MYALVYQRQIYLLVNIIHSLELNFTTKNQRNDNRPRVFCCICNPSFQICKCWKILVIRFWCHLLDVRHYLSGMLGYVITHFKGFFYKPLLAWLQKSKAVPLHVMETVGERKYSSYSFLTSALDEGEWSESRPGRILPLVKGPQSPIDSSLSGPQSRSGYRR